MINIKEKEIKEDDFIQNKNESGISLNSDLSDNLNTENSKRNKINQQKNTVHHLLQEGFKH